MPTILVVDDDQQIRAWLRQILESKGYEVEEASDGKEALVICERVKPALVVLDIFMPNMDGLEFILHNRSGPQSAKFLVLSGNLVNGYRMCQTARVFGAHDAIDKPFSAEEFIRRVETLFSKT